MNYPFFCLLSQRNKKLYKKGNKDQGRPYAVNIKHNSEFAFLPTRPGFYAYNKVLHLEKRKKYHSVQSPPLNSAATWS